MAKNVQFVSHKKSKLKVDGKPQLPSPSVLAEGEIAVNFAEGVETLSIKNESGTVVTFSSDDYYTEKKLGSGFTGENSANTVTDVITDNELVWTSAFLEMSGNVDTLVSSISGKSLTQITSSNNSISASTAATSDGTVKADLKTDASKISGLTAVQNSDEGAAKISGVTATDSVKKGIENLYKSLASEIAARKDAILARTITSDNKGITITETPNADGFSTSIELKLDDSTNGTGKEKTGTDNALSITNDGLFLSSNWTCGEY